MNVIKRKFKCTGCGEDRPCFLETNQEKSVIDFYDNTEDLKCVLDETNQTSYNWVEIQYSDAELKFYKDTVLSIQRILNSNESEHMKNARIDALVLGKRQ